MAVQPETRLTNRIRGTILDRWPRAWVMKVAGGLYQTAGIPDLLVLIDGHFFGLEVKCPKPGESDNAARKRATLRQRLALDAIRKAGGTAAVIISPEEALWIIGRALKQPD